MIKETEHNNNKIKEKYLNQERSSWGNVVTIVGVEILIDDQLTQQRSQKQTRV
jgi:hypothetical protein